MNTYGLIHINTSLQLDRHPRPHRYAKIRGYRDTEHSQDKYRDTYIYLYIYIWFWLIIFKCTRGVRKVWEKKMYIRNIILLFRLFILFSSSFVEARAPFRVYIHIYIYNTLGLITARYLMAVCRCCFFLTSFISSFIHSFIHLSISLVAFLRWQIVCLWPKMG